MKLFKRKSKAEKLESKYKSLMHKAYEMSTVNRSKSDAYHKEAQDVLDEINQLK